MKIEDEIRKAVAALKLRLKEVDRRIAALLLIRSRQRPSHRCRRRASLAALILLALTVSFTIPAHAESKAETALRAELAQQRAAAQTTIDRLTRQNSALATNRVAAPTGQALQDAVDSTAQTVKDSGEKTDAKIAANSPANSVPVWLAAIAGIVSVVGVLGSIVLAFINKSKLAEIHVLANSNLSQVTDELREANEKIAGLREMLGLAKSQSAP